MEITTSTRCDCDCDRIAADPDRRISSHRTSRGRVIYFRCYCGMTRIQLWRWARPESAAS